MKDFFRRLAPRTLRGRLSLVALTTAALLMTVLTVVFNVMVDRHLRNQADDELRNRAAAAASTVDTRGSRVRVLETAGDQFLDANVWIYSGARVIEKPPSATAQSPLSRAAGRLAAQKRHACITAAESPGSVRLCAQPLHDKHAVTVVTALALGPYRSSADVLLLGSLALDAAMLVCTYALTRLAVGRALHPVRTMTDQAMQRSAVASAERFGAAEHPAELARLGTSLDALLDRIRTVLRHEQQLTGELSHELRTPLTRIIIELDWWRARPRTDAETRATHEVIAEAAQSMRTICDTLLHEARESMPSPSKAPGTTDVVLVLGRLVEQLDPRVSVKAVVEAEDPELEAGVTPAVLERIVSPLLSNALRHARSSVAIRVRRAVGAVRIDITDDGPGVPQTFLSGLFQPGRRADCADGHDGAGLGLPLARRLARSVGGEVSYDRGHTPGARFTVTLPTG
ncbi:signal transduction histidine kinase [Streptomyces griseochromogenes]|uniref:histidine kinase n=1 Tax=Streptomyces griseochromogenes TaxID=68214 RepID=A0A1B1B2P7_9ACTN|nr:HAMP domain-containing sensor histidine kinase [Streptomyces griseochromogenes]ANP53098.1 two-component sensor histidine kinase [Streptomyces griseochromogenes]MBP2047792.1 signal transduction histidine kinase [Streptomyces griseochromogenes]